MGYNRLYSRFLSKTYMLKLCCKCVQSYIIWFGIHVIRSQFWWTSVITNDLELALAEGHGKYVLWR